MRLCPQQHRFVYIDRFFQLNKHKFFQPHMIIKHKLMRLAHGCCISRPVIGRFLPKFLCWGSCISAGTDDQDSSIKVTSWTPDDLIGLQGYQVIRMDSFLKEKYTNLGIGTPILLSQDDTPINTSPMGHAVIVLISCDQLLPLLRRVHDPNNEGHNGFSRAFC